MPGLGVDRADKRDQRLLRRERLRQRSDYLQCYRQGRRRHGPLFTLHFVPNPSGHPRLGITASRKVGNAVARHALKRRIREIFRRWDGRRGLPALDLVFHLKPGCAAAGRPEFEAEMLRLLGSLAKGRGQ